MSFWLSTLTRGIMKKKGIEQKASWNVFVTVSLLGLGLLIAGFFGVWDLRYHTSGQRHRQDAVIFSEFISQQLDNEIRNISTYLMSSPWWHDMLKKANLRYAAWDPKAIKEYMARMDGQWLPAAADTPFIQGYLGSPMSRRLKSLTEQNTSIAEIFFTDQYGGLIAASGKTSDFYQADEPWWQYAYNNGKGAIFVGDVEKDVSSGKISIAIAIPFKDAAGQVFGISKTIIDIAFFFQPLKQYRLGRTGYVVLLDQQGNVVFHPTVSPMKRSELSAPELDRILKNGHGFGLTRHGFFRARSLVAAAEVRSPFLETAKIRWFVAVVQSGKEIFGPLYRIFSIVTIFSFFILLLIIFRMKMILRNIFITPLQKIREGAQQFTDGKLDFRIEVKTADELEQLAKSLNEMSEHLKQTMVSRDKLSEEAGERQKAEEALIASEKRFFDIFYSSVTATLLINRNKFVDANEAAAQMLGYKNRKEFLKTHPSELSPPTQPDGRGSFEKADEMMRLALEKGFHQFEWVHRKADGVDFPVRVSLTPITLRNERILHCVWIDLSQQKKDETLLLQFQDRLKDQASQLKDSLDESRKSREILSSMLEDNNETREELEKSLKELKSTHELLAQAEKMEAIGRMASGVAHEVKNPLGIILQGINFFEGMLPPEENDQRKVLGMMKDNVKRADKIVRALLDFSRTQETHVEPQDINAIIQTSLELVTYRLNLNSVEIVCDLGKGLPPLPLDIGKIEQVFVNLFNNAADAMPTGGELYVRSYFLETEGTESRPRKETDAIIKLKGKTVIVEVEDTGVGIDENIIKSVFDPFFTTKNRTEGTGLGLSIARSLIEMHGGLIDIESTKGKGTKFTLAFKIP